jgi:hypothetical protein
VDVLVTCWDAAQFAAAREPWQQLLAHSDADPLFMSWDWQWRWWQHHGEALGAVLHLLAVHDDGKLVGLAPFYSRRVTTRSLRSCRLEIMGIAWRESRAVYSDYLDLIVHRDRRQAVIEAVAEWLVRERFWRELAFCSTSPAGAAAELLRTSLARRVYVRQVDPLDGWVLRLSSRFTDYVQALDSDTRRKLFNQRGKLPGLIQEQASEAQLTEYLGLLRTYAQARWGEAAGGSGFEAFLDDFAAFAARSGQLRLTRLTTADGPLSVMFNVRVGERVYYLQSGFDPARSQGVSPGFLHFGYAIEAAIEEGARTFDLLAGRGRHRDYKPDLLTERVPLVTYHAVRGWRRALYGAYGRLSA